MHPAPLTILLALGAALPATVAAQQLRHAVADATRVVVARAEGVQPLGNEFFVHRYVTVETLKGEPVERFSIVERKRVADQPRPTPTAVKLLCLRPEGETELPARYAPYFRMTGHAGEDPVVDDSPASAARMDLVRALIASERGAAPGATATALTRIAMRGTGSARVEAVESLREREVLRGELSMVDREALMLLAVGELEDVPLKIAAASLCAEAGMEDVVPALTLSLDQVDDERFIRAFGRIARHVHGEDATKVLTPLISRAQGVRRDRLLLALGATRTESALDALLKMHEKKADDAAVVAALRQHGSPRAIEAIEPPERER